MKATTSSNSNAGTLKLIALFIVGIAMIFILKHWLGYNGNEQNQTTKSVKMMR